MKLTPAGETFFASSADNKVRQFNAADQKQLREFTGAKDSILPTAYDATNKRLAGGAFDGQVEFLLRPILFVLLVILKLILLLLLANCFETLLGFETPLFRKVGSAK